MKEEDLIFYGALAIGGYMLYRSLSGGYQTPQQTSNVFTNSGYKSHVIRRMGTGTKSAVVDVTDGQTNTRYFFDEGEGLNFAQRLLLKLGLPIKWVIE